MLWQMSDFTETVYYQRCANQSFDGLLFGCISAYETNFISIYLLGYRTAENRIQADLVTII